MRTQPFAFAVTLCALSVSQLSAAELERDYPIRPVPAHQVRFRDAFWQPRLEANRTATIPLSFQMCEETGRIENFKVAAGTSDKKWTGKFGFNDSDVFKILEGAAYSLMTHPDARLESYVDELIGHIAAAQEDDGYLYTAWTARDKIDNPANIICCYPKENKWVESKLSHELYNLGHMYEAAAAHFAATGKKNFLEVATKSADMLVKSFGPGKMEVPPGHPEIELGLVKLYRTTGDARYLDLAKYFLELRGKPTDDRPELWGEYSQDHKPLREQDEAVGHAVRAIYLYAGATDVAALTGDRELTAVLDRLWENIVSKKTYITGGIGATAEGEAFGKNYHLPNESAYSETCANLATCLWNHRMFLLHGDAKYIDMLERALFNSTISGVALDGKSFFYPNPLASTGNYERSKWFDCACCPTNLCRFIPSIPGYVYAVRDDALYVNLFVAGSADVELDSGKVHIEQETMYPWYGNVVIKVAPEKAGQQLTLKIRIPGWARNQAFASDLYRYTVESNENATISVNGRAMKFETENGYAEITRQWQPGDSVTLDLPMPVRRVVAHESVEANRGREALMRGPLVFCIEWPDVPGGQVRNLVVRDEEPLDFEFRNDLLGGVQVVTGTARRYRNVTEATRQDAENPDGEKQIRVAEEVLFTAIPYYAWAHRGPGEMAVWLPRTPEILEAKAEPKAP
jgi:DUF1680 family protein